MKYISLFLLATTKFLLAPPAAIGIGLPTWEAFAICVAGGFVGVLFYYNFAGFLMRKAFERKLKKSRELGIRVKNFTKLNKTLVKIKHSPIGLYAIALITPVVFSIPVGSIICAKFYHHKKQTIPMLFAGVILWGILLTYFSGFIKEIF